MEGLSQLFSIDGLLAFLTLSVLEIVLGIDNLIFLSILVKKAPKEKQRFTRILGLALALVFRIVLLLGISWIVQLKEPILSIYEFNFSLRDLILLVGGLFLLTKSTLEIHEKLEEQRESNKSEKKLQSGISMILLQIIAIDLVFSLDSILTAVGLTQNITIMISAVIISMLFMMVFAGWVSEFIHKNPTIIMLALSFLIMIGVLLIADAFHFHVPRGYIYFSLGFSLLVEILNLKLLKKHFRRKF